MEDGQAGMSGANVQWPVEMESMKDQGHAQILHHNLREMSAQEMKGTPKSVSGRSVQVTVDYEIILQYLIPDTMTSREKVNLLSPAKVSFKNQPG